MKINITATSSIFNNIVIDANSIDDVIKKLQTDRQLVESIIDKDCSDLHKDLTKSFIFPESFVLHVSKEDDYDAEIEIYDNYRE